MIVGGTAAGGGVSGSGQTAEAVVLTALNLEYRAVRQHLTGLRRATHAMGTRFDLGHLPGVARLIALGRTGQGDTAAAVVAARATEAFRPRALLCLPDAAREIARRR